MGRARGRWAESGRARLMAEFGVLRLNEDMFDNGRVSRWMRPDTWQHYAPIEPKIRHVWVRAAGGHGPDRPGLVIAWRVETQPSPSQATGWSAQVAVVMSLDYLSIQWVPAEHLRPVEGAEVPVGLDWGKQAAEQQDRLKRQGRSP